MLGFGIGMWAGNRIDNETLEKTSAELARANTYAESCKRAYDDLVIKGDAQPRMPTTLQLQFSTPNSIHRVKCLETGGEESCRLDSFKN